MSGVKRGQSPEQMKAVRAKQQGKRGLSKKQMLFVKEYLVSLNATKAATKAGYSKKTAESIGYENLRKPQIVEVIRKEIDKRSEKLEITADRVLKEIARLAFYDVDIYKNVKSPEDISNLPEDARRAIVGYKWDTQGNFRLQLSPKTPSLDQLGRHLKLFTDRLELTDNRNLAEKVKAARERTNKAK